LVPWRPPEIPLPTRGALRTLRGAPGAHRHERAAPPPTILPISGGSQAFPHLGHALETEFELLSDQSTPSESAISTGRGAPGAPRGSSAAARLDMLWSTRSSNSAGARGARWWAQRRRPEHSFLRCYTRHKFGRCRQWSRSLGAIQLLGASSNPRCFPSHAARHAAPPRVAQAVGQPSWPPRSASDFALAACAGRRHRDGATVMEHLGPQFSPRASPGGSRGLR